MTGPERILRTLDRNLDHPVRLILYGRGALALGFPLAPSEFSTTLDVDVILPNVEISEIDADETFWLAIEKTNQELDFQGLYLTHLFLDTQVILTPDWLQKIVPISLPGLQYLTLFRPSTPDLILTKMMRVDPQDRSDIMFLLQSELLTPTSADHLFSSARIPKIVEIQDAFKQNSEWLIHQLAS